MYQQNQPRMQHKKPAGVMANCSKRRAHLLPQALAQPVAAF
jgi:hypothetical protein